MPPPSYLCAHKHARIYARRKVVMLGERRNKEAAQVSYRSTRTEVVSAEQVRGGGAVPCSREGGTIQ